MRILGSIWIIVRRGVLGEALLLGVCLFFSAGGGESSASTICPALTADGHRLPAPPVLAGMDTLPDLSAIPAGGAPTELGDQARSIVSAYETGKADGFEYISALDTMSVGISQWNVGTGSFYDVLLVRIPMSAFDLANPQIRYDLISMRNEPAKRAKIIRRWKTPGPNDPLLAGVRRSIHQNLSTWLSSEPVVKVQRSLTNDDLDWAWKRSLAWRNAEKSDAPISAALLATFYDLKVYNGGDLSDLWYANVAEFRRTHTDTTAILAELSTWLTQCQAVYHPEKAEDHRKLYSLKDLALSIDLWKTLARVQPARFTDDVNDLLVFGYLRAQRSVGRNPPNGFPGIYQADVLLRRGTEAVGEGYRGQKITLYNQAAR
ncbi:hypothetical protein EN784_01160 [bacterium M00.F.Ca.ET.141.01.1.1]|nr:hypothetical protein EN784_01160 [bacterium M00.F.Ca.ET.141.01.1.1]